MSDNKGIFGEVLESAGTAVKQTGKAVASAVSDSAKAAASQAGVPVGDSSAGSSQDATSQVSNEDVVEGLYEKSQPQNTNPPQQPVSNQTDSSGKTPQEAAEIEVVRKRLHDEYYQRDFNRPKQEEERVAEKVEREEKEEMVDLQQKKMEKPPELVQRAAQRVEKFPGASG